MTLQVETISTCCLNRQIESLQGPKGTFIRSVAHTGYEHYR